MSDSNEVKEVRFDKLRDELNQLIDNKKSFVVIGVPSVQLVGKVDGKSLEETTAVEFIENEIEKKSMSCRVYTRNRGYAAAAATAMWVVPGLISAASIAIHKLATYNPDYEIGKCIASNKLYVDYKK